MSEIENDTEKIMRESLKKRTDLQEILDGLDKSTLVSVLLEYADENQSFKETLLFRFAEKPDAVAYATKLIRTSIKNAATHGFVEYADVHASIQGAEKVLEMISTHKDIFEAVELYCLVLREMIDLERCCDDSNGHVGGVIARALHGLSDITKNLPTDFLGKEKLANILVNYSAEKIYGGWDEWMFSVLNTVLPLCDVPAAREKLEKRLSDIISERESKPDSSISSDYTLHEAQNMRYHILCDFDGEAVADEYLEQHLSNPDFRRHAIEKAMSKNRLERALELCLNGEAHDERWAGLVLQWQKYRYSVYEKQNNIAGQKELAFEFAADGDFEYFLALKNFYTADEWSHELLSLLKFIKDGRAYGNDIYVKILIHEHLTEELLEYCKQHISRITELYPHLVPQYIDDVDSMFLTLINQNAKIASSRDRYHEVCNIISGYKKACGKKRAGLIIAELESAHSRQRAFLDELAHIS